MFENLKLIEIAELVVLFVKKKKPFDTAHSNFNRITSWLFSEKLRYGDIYYAF